MDIELLSSLVRKLIIESDEVSVPGLGTFAATLVPASFSDRGYTINPPYRKLDFIPTGDEAAAPSSGDAPAIVRRISSARKIAEPQAAEELAECVKAIRAALEAERLAELPGLGKLRLTKEGEMFFVAAEDLNIYPEGFGLEPVSLKNKEAQESAKEEAESAAKSPEMTPAGAEITESAAKSPEMTPAGPEITESAAKSPEMTPIELLIDPIGGDSDSNHAGTTESAALDGNSAPKPAAATPGAATPAPKARKKIPTAVRVLLVIVAVLIVAVVALRLLGTYAPDFIDRLLYSPEELEILRQGL